MMSELDPPQLRSIASATDRVRPVTIDARVAAVYFIGDRAAFVGDEETVTLVAGDGEKVAVTVHGGAILSSASDGARIITGGDDGNVVALDAKGESSLLVTDAKRRWIDNVAVHPDGTIAWSAGKTAFVRGLKGEDKTLDAPSSVGALAFAPKGLGLWIRSVSTIDAIGLDDSAGDRWGISTRPGGFWIGMWPASVASARGQFHLSDNYRPPNASRNDGFAGEPFCWRTLGFDAWRFPGRSVVVSVPFWFVIARAECCAREPGVRANPQQGTPETG